MTFNQNLLPGLVIVLLSISVCGCPDPSKPESRTRPPEEPTVDKSPQEPPELEKKAPDKPPNPANSTAAEAPERDAPVEVAAEKPETTPDNTTAEHPAAKTTRRSTGGGAKPPSVKPASADVGNGSSASARSQAEKHLNQAQSFARNHDSTQAFRAALAGWQVIRSVATEDARSSQLERQLMELMQTHGEAQDDTDQSDKPLEIR